MTIRWQHFFAVQSVRSEVELVEEAIARLPSQTRQVFYLCRFTDLSYPEIGKQLQLDVRNVESSLANVLMSVHQARVRYKKLIRFSVPS